MIAASFPAFPQGQDAVGGSLESLATTIPTTEFTVGLVLDLLTHQRLFSAQLQVCTASTRSYGKIQYLKINLIFSFTAYFQWNSQTHPVNKVILQLSGFTGSIHQECQPAQGKTVRNTSVCLQFHTCYYHFMYNYI